MLNSSTSVIYGILIQAALQTFQNNMIQLGLDTAGNSLNTGTGIQGILESIGTDNFYFKQYYT
jgi:hypothetical protein